MRWRVTYRGKDGRQADDVFEAESRAELFKVLSGKGISAVRIEEYDGKKRVVRNRPTGKNSPSKTMIVALAAIAIIAGGALWLVLGGNSGKSTQDVKTERPAKATSAAQPSPKPAVKPTVPEQQPAAPEKPEPPPYEKKPGQMQLPNGKILTFPAPKEGETRKVYAYGHMYECDSEGNFRDITPRKLFHTAFEGNFLGLAVEDKPFIPAFLKGLDQDEVKKILMKNYQPIGDETEEEMAQLKAYDDMRCAALQYMEEGGTFDEFVDYFANQVKKERQTQAMCLREVMTLYKEGKIAEAKEMAEAAVALKAKQGLKSFKLPPHVLEAFDAIQ